VLADEADMDGATLLKSAQTAGVATQFQQNTQQAIAANVFGAPWYVFEGQSYWGQDRLEFLERAFANSKI
jgi:2-hydroxychromene-2-carboxylate isomerase